jgi:hypothetical protein
LPAGPPPPRSGPQPDLELTLAGTAQRRRRHRGAPPGDLLRSSAQDNGGRDERLHYFLRGLLLQREGRHATDAFRRSLYFDRRLHPHQFMLAGPLDPQTPASHRGAAPAIPAGRRRQQHLRADRATRSACGSFEQAGQRDSARCTGVESAWRRADPHSASATCSPSSSGTLREDAARFRGVTAAAPP